jgi:hypothetical protein
MSNNQPEETVIACNPRAIDPSRREAHIESAESIFSASTVQEIKELVNGYAFRLPLETPMLYKAVEFVANERLCCPFFTFTLVIGEQFWLELSGTQEVKDYIKANIVSAVQTGAFPTAEALEAAYTASTASNTL